MGNVSPSGGLPGGFVTFDSSKQVPVVSGIIYSGTAGC
jgi:hypothetical protein